MWQILIVLYFIFSTTNYILRRRFAQDFGEHNKAINSIFFIFFLLPVALVLLFFFPPNLNPGVLNLLLLAGGSIIWPLFNLASFSANRHVDVGLYSIITNLSPIFTLAIAGIFLSENLTSFQYLGILLLVLSGVIATVAQLKKRVKSDREGLLFCMLAALIMGVAIAYESFMLKRVGFGTYILYGWGAQIVWAAIMAGPNLKNIPSLFRKIGKNLTIWGASKALGAVCFITALNISGNASIISAATDFLSVVIVLAAFFYLKERQHICQKLIGAGVGIVGLLLIAK